MNVLISLHKGYGLGDAVQMSAVLRHVKKYRPHWIVDFQAEEGRECVGRGHCANVFNYGTPYPHNHYNAEVQILLYDTICNYHDKPNTRVVSCLHERFDIPWDRECAKYEIEVSERAMEAAAILTTPNYKQRKRDNELDNKVVALHYKGDSSQSRKDLTHQQAETICRLIESMGSTPLLLDWRNVSPLTDKLNVRTTGRIPTSKRWGADIEMNCAVISSCRAFIGIDSGPSKCASATETPSLVVWTGHHPTQFHDPAHNTTHLVPVDYKGLYPEITDRKVLDWFETNYNVRFYTGDPVDSIRTWLEETLSEKLSMSTTTENSRTAEARRRHRRHDG